MKTNYQSNLTSTNMFSNKQDNLEDATWYGGRQEYATKATQKPIVTFGVVQYKHLTIITTH